MKKIVLISLTLALSFGASAQSRTPGDVYTFEFVPGNDMFYIPWSGNGVELDRLYSLVDQYHSRITSGEIPVYVDGYCASSTDTGENLRIAIVRSNRVKSELIICKELLEEHFTTKNHVTSYTAPDGAVHKDIVVVMLRIPAKPEPEVRTEALREEPPRKEQVAVERQPETVTAGPVEQVVIPEPVASGKPYCLDIRTNLLYDALLIPTLGVEWHVNRSIGVKMDGSYGYWGDKHGKVQKIWLVNPGLRWYMGDRKRFYVGASCHFGEYNIYKGMIGGMFDDDKGYQGKLWNVGADAGYRLYLSHGFSLDFNLGLGYTRSEYDSFTVRNRTRVYVGKNRSKTFWGPTQAGISLVWTIGGRK